MSVFTVDRERVDVVIKALVWLRANDEGQGGMFRKADAKFGLNYNEGELLVALAETIAKVQV